MASGQGKPGFCKICAHEQAPRFIKGARDGWSAPEAQEVGKAFGLTFGRDTWANHKKHAITTEQKVIQASVALADGPKKITKSTNDDFLAAIRDIGMTKAVNNPDDVTIDQALKAAQILEARKDKGGDGLRVLINIMTGHASPPPVIVEGEVL